MSSLAVLEDGKTLRVELLFILLPLGRVKLSQALIAQNFKLFICLRQLSIDVLLIGSVALADGELLVGLVPFSVAANRIQLSRVLGV